MRRAYIAGAGLILLACMLSGCSRQSLRRPEAASEPGKKAVDLEGEKGKPLHETPSGLKYIVLEEGAGRRPQRGEIVIVEYTGWLSEGRKFDSSAAHLGPFRFRVGVGEVIPAFDEACLDMREGERRKLIVPPSLGFGAQGLSRAGIPPNAELIFDIRLVRIVSPQTN